MRDILSQKDIDELLNALSTGELDVKGIQKQEEEKKIYTYDFRRSNKFAKDHLRTLQFIHENYARMVQSFLSGYLRTVVHVEVVSVETLPYSDFQNAINDTVALGVVDFSPLSGYIIYKIDPEIVFAIIDRILGGKGTTIESVRGFSEIELVLIEKIIVQLLNLMREPWSNVVSVKPRLERIETNRQFIQFVNPTEMIALVTLRIKVGDAEGCINICLPHMVVEPIVPKLSTKLWFSSIKKEITEHTRKNIEAKIENTVVPVKANLGYTTISVSDFLDLQIGDVIPLNRGLNSNIEIFVGDLLKFHAKPGVKRNKISVKIMETVGRNDE